MAGRSTGPVMTECPKSGRSLASHCPNLGLREHDCRPPTVGGPPATTRETETDDPPNLKTDNAGLDGQAVHWPRPRSVRVIATLLLGQELLELGAKLFGCRHRLVGGKKVLAICRERVVLLLECLHDLGDFA